MTVLEASGTLYQWFSENDSFCLEKDFLKIIPITDSPKRDRAAILSALKDLEEAHLIAGSSHEDTEYWILRKSFASFEQSVSISADVALTVSLMINKFCDIIGDEKQTCDATNITEQDIKNLIFITNLMSNKDELDNLKEEE
jgi:hypothetical protein